MDTGHRLEKEKLTNGYRIQAGEGKTDKWIQDTAQRKTALINGHRAQPGKGKP